MRTQIKVLLRNIPAVPIYFYLLFLSVTSTTLFIFLMLAVNQ